MNIDLSKLNAQLKKRGFPCGNWSLGLPYDGNVTVAQATQAVSELNRDADRVRAQFALSATLRS